MSQLNVWNQAEEEKQNELQMFDIAKNGLVPKTTPIHTPTMNHNVQALDLRLTESNTHQPDMDSTLPLILMLVYARYSDLNHQNVKFYDKT